MTQTSVKTATTLLRFKIEEPLAASPAPLFGESGPPRAFLISELALTLNRIHDLLAFSGYLVLEESGEEFGVGIEASRADVMFLAERRTDGGFAIRRFTYASMPDLWLYLGTGGAAGTAVAAREFIFTTADKVIDLWEKFSRARALTAASSYQATSTKLLHDEVKRVRRKRAAQDEDEQRLSRLLFQAASALGSTQEISLEPEPEWPRH